MKKGENCIVLGKKNFIQNEKKIVFKNFVKKIFEKM